MHKLLIADGSDDLCAVLGNVFRRKYEVHICCDGLNALALLRHIKPDMLILDLSLPKLDGLSLLRELGGDVPRTIICIADAPTHYEQQMALDLGVGYILRRPFRAATALAHMEALLEFRETKGCFAAEPMFVAEFHMNALSMNPGHDGYQQLRIGIPLFRQDPSVRLSKELYPAIATRRPEDTPSRMERSMRGAIACGFKAGEPAIWERYFPGCQKPPAVKEFIARLAQLTEPKTPDER